MIFHTVSNLYENQSRVFYEKPYICRSILSLSMGIIRKGFSLLLVIILTVSSLIMVESAFAQSLPKPSVPEFSLKVVSYPYYVTPTTTINPYTGKTVTTQYGYQEENKSIEITIKNQPFTPYIDSNGNSMRLFYNITVKGHYDVTWNYAYTNPYRGLLNASNSDYTTISMPIGHHSTVPSGGYPLEGVDTGDSVDFQVQAQIGYYNKSYTGMLAPVVGGDFYYVFTGQTSGWSNTQTITIGETSASTSPNPTTTSQNPAPTPTVPELPSWTIPLLLTIMVASAGLLVYLKKHKQNSG